jgi:superfamily II DNA or RNA helicase
MDATKTLRDYQEKLVFSVCRAPGDVLVEQPTGSGKTVQIATLVAMHLGKRFTHAVISAPQEQIEQGFVQRDYSVVAFPQRPGVAVPSIQVPNKPVHKALIRAARESGNLGSVKRVVQYLRQSGAQDHAWACTHAALNRFRPQDLPDDLTAKALFIDEAHHASADGLSQILTLWRERGGQLFFFTATPYRGDGRPVKLDGMRTYRRSLAEHMAEGFAPRQLESEIVALGQPGEGDAVTAAQFTGEEAPPASYFDALVAAICRRWRDDGKPKAIVRVPPMQGGKSGDLVRALAEALARENARVLDATGTGTRDKQRFLAALKAEQQQTFATSTFDVMIGIQRVLEGTDWPLCSAVYCVGMPGSLNTVVQFLGRAMRLKGPDYPADQRDRAKLVFFVPCGGGSALADLSIDHSRHALLTCCFLADHEVGQEWIVLREVRRGIEAALGPRGENPAAIDAENEADEPLDPEVRAEVELAMADAREQMIRSGNEPTVGDVVQLAAKTRPDLPEVAIRLVATEILAAVDNPTGTAARKAIQREIAKRLRIDPKVKEAMAAAFAVVLEEFRSATLKDSAVLESVGRQVHGVTGGQMREFAQRLREAAPRPLTEQQVLTWADHHFAVIGDWPNRDSGPIIDAAGEQWVNVNLALQQGFRGFPGGSSLAKLLTQHRGVRNNQHLPKLTEDQILSWADLYHARTGKWPIVEARAVDDAAGENWATISHALEVGARGLPGGSSLAKLLQEKRGVRNHLNLSSLTKEQILAWADAYYDINGKWPNRRSGPVNGTSGESWVAINTALATGARRLPGGSSLAELLQEERGVRNRGKLVPLTVEAILEWADSHYHRTGQWPSLTSGVVSDAPGEKWVNIDKALQAGGRGLPGGSSLAKLLNERRGVRYQQQLPQLTEEQILLWVDSYRAKTNKWPRQRSGTIGCPPGETWTGIDQALRAGRRGLSPGSSLARLLEERRGVPSHMNRPPLTYSQILAWAYAYFARTGQWPNGKSGSIAESPGDTWSNIKQALIKGLRDLPGGSSLSRLIKEHRDDSVLGA